MFERFFAKRTPFPFIPFERFKDASGGPGTFMRNLKAGLDAAGFRYLENERDYRKAAAIFFPIAYDPRILAWFKKRRLPILQRLDGLYYPSQHGPDYARKNRKLEVCYKEFSDLIIFQSDYARKICRHMLGPPRAAKDTIIYNGADGAIFYPDPEKAAVGSKPVFITTGNIRHEEQIRPLIEALDALAGGATLIIAGAVEPELQPFLKKPYVDFRGPVNLERVGELLRRADIFIYSILNSSCPNSVIEAIRCGLPVVAFDSGAIAELCSFNRELLAPVSGDLIQTKESFDSRRLLEKIRLCLDGFSGYKERALANGGLFALEDMARGYMEILAAACH